MVLWAWFQRLCALYEHCSCRTKKKSIIQVYTYSVFPLWRIKGMQKKTDARETALEAPSATCVNCEGSKTLDLTWQFRKDRYFSKCPQTFALCRWQWRSQPKNLEGAKKFGGANMFDFRRITLFCLEKCLSKRKMTIFSKILGVHGPFNPPGYAYGRWSSVTSLKEWVMGMNVGRGQGGLGPLWVLKFDIWQLTLQ